MESTFNKFTHEFLTFKNYKNNGLNSIALYPAMMIDEMQKCILEEVLKIYDKKENLVLLDPFHGAGTSLLIAKELGLHQIGFDINPLANLIAKTKLYNYDNSVFEDKNKLFAILDSDIEYENHSFEKIEKWFRKDIIKSLSKVRMSIIKIENKKNRLLFWTIFSNIVRKYSNSRSSTFKLHIKEQSKIDSMENKVVDDFKKEIENALQKISYSTDNNITTNLYCGDSLNLLDIIDENSIDIICTSPPYGDNSTTVTYGQFSSLALRWILREDLDSSVDKVDYNYSSIDNLSLGGKKRNSILNLKCASSYIDSLSKSKKQKVINFVTDYVDIFSKLSTKIKKGGFMILTVGNRKVDNKLFPFVKVNDELAKLFGFVKIIEKRRDILNKRIAKKISKVNSTSVESMSEEYILIYKKEGGIINA
ncbi:modification methylase [Firmicutes bacterium CAG:631]|nr:modification methylase [Firmicutes bacterium CAG:631]